MSYDMCNWQQIFKVKSQRSGSCGRNNDCSIRSGHWKIYSLLLYCELTSITFIADLKMLYTAYNSYVFNHCCGVVFQTNSQANFWLLMENNTLLLGMCFYFVNVSDKLVLNTMCHKLSCICCVHDSISAVAASYILITNWPVCPHIPSHSASAVSYHAARS